MSDSAYANVATAQPQSSTDHPEAADVSAVTGSLRPVRWTALIFLGIDASDNLVHALIPGSLGGKGELLDVLIAVLGLCACALLLWQRWFLTAVTVIPVLALSAYHGGVGADFRLLIVGAGVAGFSLAPRRLWISVIPTVGVSVLLASSLPVGSQLRAGLIACFCGLVSTGVGAVGRRLWREREYARQLVQRQERDNQRVRVRERRRLAAELRDRLDASFAGMRAKEASVRASCDLAEMREALDYLGATARATLAALRLVLHTLRTEDDVASPAPPTSAWVSRLRSARLRLLLGGCCLVIAAPIMVATSAGCVFTMALAGAAVASVAVALWRGRWGAALAGGTLLAGAVVPVPVGWVALSAGVIAFIEGRRGNRGWLAVILGGLFVLTGVLVTRHGLDGADPAVAIGTACGLGLLAGLSLGHFEMAHDRWAELRRQLHAERRLANAQDRDTVARDLHDIVGRHLSLISLQALGGEGEADTELLRDRLCRVARALEDGQDEIDSIVAALDLRAADEAPYACAVAPSVVGARLAEHLRHCGLGVQCAVEPALDALEPMTRSTVSRILEELGTNAMRYAPPGSTCFFSASYDGSAVRIEAHNRLADHRPRGLSSGYGLRGVRERLDLTGGEFNAGAEDGWWRVRVWVPHGEESSSFPAGSGRATLPQSEQSVVLLQEVPQSQ